MKHGIMGVVFFIFKQLLMSWLKHSQTTCVFKFYIRTHSRLPSLLSDIWCFSCFPRSHSDRRPIEAHLLGLNYGFPWFWTLLETLDSAQVNKILMQKCCISFLLILFVVCSIFFFYIQFSLNHLSIQSRLIHQNVLVDLKFVLTDWICSKCTIFASRLEYRYKVQ